MEQLCPGVYRVGVPLPHNPLKELNVHIVTHTERNLIIDTGFNAEPCKAVLFSAIKELELIPEKTDVVITHLHADHCGMAGELESMGMKVYASVEDGNTINQMVHKAYWSKLDLSTEWYGLEPGSVPYEHHPGYKYAPKNEVGFLPLHPGAHFVSGGVDFEIIGLPGHTPGHIGLYSAEKGWLFSGDHILDSITPNISFWGFEHHSLRDYFDSLEKVSNLNVKWCFTAHRNVITETNQRIEELKNHHYKRLAEVRQILSEGEQTIRATATKMHWDFRAPNFDAFPPNQQWFAAGEAAAHLEYLVDEGQAVRRFEGNVLVYGPGEIALDEREEVLIKG